MGDVHNAIKYDTGLLSALAVGTGLSRDQGGVERTGETLTPIVDAYTIPEFQALRGSYYAGVTGTQAATAAEFSCVALINPAGSGLIVTVDALSCVTLTTNSGVLIEVTSEAVVRAALAGVETRGLYRDRRRTATSARCSSLVGTEATSVGGEIEQLFPSGAGVSAAAVTSLPIVLPPGQAVVARCGTVNLAFRASFGWRERAALPGELQEIR